MSTARLANLARLRVRAAQGLQRRLVGRGASGIPGAPIRDLLERQYDADVAASVRAIHAGWPAHTARYPVPADLPVWVRRQKAFDATRVYELRDVTVSPGSGLVQLAGGETVLESIGSLHRLLGWGGMLHEGLLEASQDVGGGPVAVHGWNAFYHWLLESLPATLTALDTVPDASVLLSSRAPGVVTQAWQHVLGADAEKRLIRVDGQRVHVDHAVVAGLHEHSGFVSEHAIARLHRAFVPPTDRDGDRIYVSRRGVARRALDGEVELEQRLAAVGVRTVRAEELDLDAQIATFAAAELIIAPHGAGLANLIWRTRPAEVVELFPYGHGNDCYARLSATLGHAYSMVHCAPDPTGATAGRIPVDEIVRSVGGR